ncbi:hypothetical protein DFH09DRAFT_1409603 [Mycena vulgaris]|nr:hypothetical protein DFH09DRAFT_1409603 [Mycena vulgaris]
MAASIQGVFPAPPIVRFDRLLNMVYLERLGVVAMCYDPGSPRIITTKMPDSVAALCARLEELAAAIETQQEVLKSLENTRTAVRRQLNGLRDPVARLPLEISSEIFIDCLLNSTDHPSPTIAPLLLLNICNSWANIALSTTALWANLTLDIPTDTSETAQHRELFSGWLGRARGRPLSLSLSGSAYSGIRAIIGQHAHQLRKLELTLPSAAYPKIFHKTAIFPCLKSLTIHDELDADYHLYNVQDSLQMFQSAPNLIEFTIQDRAYRLSEPPAAAKFVHHCLRTLKIDEEGTSILRFLTLPALESLNIAFGEENTDNLDLIPFFTRSSPPVTRLTLYTGDPWALHMMEDCFALVPTLSHFELSGSAEFQDNLITILTNSPSNQLFPNLTKLTIVLEAHYNDNSWYETLAAMLSVRRTSPRVGVKLQSFSLEYRREWWSSRTAGPEENVKVILRGLVADGMEISIGVDGKNFLKKVPPNSI